MADVIRANDCYALTDLDGLGYGGVGKKKNSRFNSCDAMHVQNVFERLNAYT